MSLENDLVDGIESDRYAVIDVKTGDVVPMKLYLSKVNKSHWDKAFADVLAAYIGITGSSANKILAYMIRESNKDNMITATVRSIAEELDVDPSSVSKLLKKLQDREYIKKIRNGLYMLTPKMIRHGSHLRGVGMLKIWNEI